VTDHQLAERQLAERIREEWPEARARFCRDLSPERFLADLYRLGWSPEMITALEDDTRRRMAAEPHLPILEHMLDAAIAVRYPPEEQ
jgi:hypothetical protein